MDRHAGPVQGHGRLRASNGSRAPGKGLPDSYPPWTWSGSDAATAWFDVQPPKMPAAQATVLAGAVTTRPITRACCGQHLPPGWLLPLSGDFDVLNLQPCIVRCGIRQRCSQQALNHLAGSRPCTHTSVITGHQKVWC